MAPTDKFCRRCGGQPTGGVRCSQGHVAAATDAYCPDCGELLHHAFAAAKQAELDRQRAERIRRRRSPTESLKAAKDNAAESYNGFSGVDSATEAAFTAALPPVVGVSTVIGDGIGALWDRRKAKIKVSEQRIACVDCGTDHLVVVDEGVFKSVEDGHVVRKLRCPHCSTIHATPTELKERCNVYCAATEKLIVSTGFSVGSWSIT